MQEVCTEDEQTSGEANEEELSEAQQMHSFVQRGQDMDEESSSGELDENEVDQNNKGANLSLSGHLRASDLGRFQAIDSVSDVQLITRKHGAGRQTNSDGQEDEQNQEEAA